MIALPGRHPISRGPFSRRLARGALRLLAVLAVALSALVVVPTPVVAENPSGLPLPRFVTTRSTPINVRVGPGTKYDVAWIFVKAGLPVEVIQEFDTWRKIRDVDGQEGWVHQNLLSGNRAGYIAPWLADDQLALRMTRSDESGVRAWLVPGFPVQVVACDGTWCAVNAVDHPPSGRSATYSGYVPQGELWGVYEGETFD